MKLIRIPYWYLLLGPTLLGALGFLLNASVMAANHGQMPVLIPGGCGMDVTVADALHSCMTATTHLKFLADWLVIKDMGVASPGDFLEWADDAALVPCLAAWIALIFKELN